MEFREFRNVTTLCVVATLAAVSAPRAHARFPDPKIQLGTIAFGSCNQQWGPKEHWAVIAGFRPELWLWLGDNIYADKAGAADRRREYGKLKGAPEYAAFERAAMVAGTWDDHDYAYNDSGREFAGKRDSQSAFLDFLGVPASSPRRMREGVYTSHVFGPRERRVKVIVLDARYHRQKPGFRADILGAEQWRWLEREFAANDARVTVLVSSTQVLPYEHKGEKWADYPRARARLLKLLAAANQPPLRRAVILSGDRHLAEVSRLAPPGGAPLYEITSSGLTHTEWAKPAENRLRVGAQFVERNFGLLRVDWTGGLANLTADVRDVTGRQLLLVPLR